MSTATMIQKDSPKDNKHDSSDLSALRAAIDELDTQLLEILFRRATLVKEIGSLKKQKQIAPLDVHRWQQVLEKNTVHAHQLGLCPEFVEKLYTLIHQYSLHLESIPDYYQNENQ